MMDNHIEQAFNAQERKNLTFERWVEDNESRILEEYKESLDFSDVPDEFINERYIESLEN